MAGKTAQSRSSRDAGEGRAQRCVPSARVFWRRRRVREECRRAPLAGGGRGKFSGVGTDVPATAIGLQPCNRERWPTGERSNRRRAAIAPRRAKIRRRSALSSPTHRGRCGGEKTPRWISGLSKQATAHRTDRAQPEPGRRNSSLAAADLEPTRQRRARASPSRPPRRHAVTPTAWCAVAR